MIKANRSRLTTLALLGILPLAAHAMGGEPTISMRPANPDYAKAEQAIKGKQWNEAVDLLNRAAPQDEKNADIYNYLGYAERHRGNLNAALKHYARALALDPNHRGAHEYVGEAYLMLGNLPKAEEHLGAPCAEYRELKEKVAAYKQKQK